MFLLKKVNRIKLLTIILTIKITKFINNYKVFFNMLNIIDQWIPSFVVVVRDGLKKHNYSPEDDNTRRTWSRVWRYQRGNQKILLEWCRKRIYSGNLVTWYTVGIWSRGTQWKSGHVVHSGNMVTWY